MKKNRQIPKLLSKIMKISLIQAGLVIFFSGVALAHHSYAQEELNQNVSFRFENKEIKKVISSIEKITKVKFIYNPQVMDYNRKITITAENEHLGDVLEKLLKPLKINYELVGKQIVLSKTTEFLEEQEIQKNKNVSLTITGKITEVGSNQSMPGVNVSLKGTTVGTTANANGDYAISIPDNSSDGVLVFSFIGYLPLEEPIGNRSVIDVQLKVDIQTLSEVVVVGYGTLKKQDVTGSISSIKVDDIKTQGSNTVAKSLQGRLAGVQIESAGGDPGSGVRILIRGTGSINNSNPLYIVDGVQVDNINNLNPTDIASMDILKDASAAAIYGSRASNGVVLVTTKTGKKGETKIDFNSYIGFQNVTKKIDVLNATEWAKVNNAAHDNAGLARLATANSIANNPDSTGSGTNWQNQIYRTAPTKNYVLSASGGGQNYNYSFSAGYLNQDGIVKTTNYDRYNLRLKSDFTKGRIKIGETIVFSREKQGAMPSGLSGQGGNPAGAAVKMIPAFQVYDPTAVGGFGGAYGPVVDIANPVASLNLEQAKNNTNTLLFNIFAELTLLDGLKYKYNVGYTNTAFFNYDFIAPYKIGALFYNQYSKLSETRTETNYVLQEHTLNYNKAFDKHNINALAGFTYQNTAFRSINGYTVNTPSGIQVLSAGAQNPATGGYATDNSLVSYLGRLVYSYDNRYVFTATIRHDASSRFDSQYRTGVFPSIAAAWNVSNESFFAPMESVITNFKLRASYGKLGNQEIKDYSFTPLINSNINYVMGSGQVLWPGATQTAFSTPNLKWETTKTVDIGADLGFFNNRLTLTADYFVRTNSNILIQVPVPLSSGASGVSPFVNSGQITNKGVELALSYNNSIEDFTYQFTGTFTSIKNNVDNLGAGSQQIFAGQPTLHGASSTVTQAGLPVGAFYLIKTGGIFQSQDEVNAYSKDGQLIQPNAKPGDIKFIDANNDGKIDQNDRQYVGSSNPKFSFGFGGNAGWKGFDLSIFFQGTHGNKIYNGFRQDMEGMSLEQNYNKTTLNAWTPTNTHTDMPRAVINDPNLNSQTSDRFLESGSYLRFKTLQIGYSLPKELMSKVKIGSCRFYVSFDNLITITKYKGYNPDLGRTNSVLDRGVDYVQYSYPLPRTSLFGVQLSF